MKSRLIQDIAQDAVVATVGSVDAVGNCRVGICQPENILSKTNLVVMTPFGLAVYFTNRIYQSFFLASVHPVSLQE